MIQNSDAKWTYQGASLPPSAYINPPIEESWTLVDWGSSLEELSSPLPTMRLPSPPSLSRMAPQRAALERGRLHRCTTKCYGNSGSDPNRSTSAISDGFESRGTTRVVHRCAGAIALASWHCGVEIFTTLRSATSSSSSTLVWEHNPRVWSTRVYLRIFS
jgi:hypothetical protein